MSILTSPGIWIVGAFGGMSGINWQSAYLLCNDPLIWDEVSELMRYYEQGAVQGQIEKARNKGEGLTNG